MRGAVCTVIEDEKLVSSQLSDSMRTFGRTFLAKTAESDHEIELFDMFCQNLTADMKKLFAELSHRIRSPSAKKAKLWSAFHELRQTQLPKLWHDLCCGLGLDESREQSFFMQSVNQELFQQMLANYFTERCSLKSASQQVQLPPDELNAMQYACGYVPYKLLKKYESTEGDRSRRFLECLGNMAVVDEDSVPDLFSYTRVWFERVNRGGLFPLNDETFSLFIEIEKLVRVMHMVKADSTNHVKEVTKAVVEDDEVQFKWTLLTPVFDSDEEAQELLHEIVQLWVTVRGFSIAASWMETYKTAAKQTKQKSTGLRKHLS